MKPGLHPQYRTVVFHDTSANHYIKVGSTIATDREIEIDGMTYPYVTVDVSSASHPYYTGKQKTFTNEGSAARFNQRFGRFLTRRTNNNAGTELITFGQTTPSRLPVG